MEFQFAGRNKQSPGPQSSSAPPTPLAMSGGLAAKRANAPALQLGAKGLAARRGPMMKLPTSGAAAGPGSVDPQQNAFKKYADVV